MGGMGTPRGCRDHCVPWGCAGACRCPPWAELWGHGGFRDVVALGTCGGFEDAVAPGMHGASGDTQWVQGPPATPEHTVTLGTCWLWGPPAPQPGWGRFVSPVPPSPPQGLSLGGDTVQPGQWQCHLCPLALASERILGSKETPQGATVSPVSPARCPAASVAETTAGPNAGVG